MIGLAGAVDQWRWRARPEGDRAQAGDIEGTLYSLRRFVTLAVAGNPNLIGPLFAPESSVLERNVIGAELQALAPQIVSQQAVRRFIGFVDSQVELLQGQRGKSRIPVRTDLIDAHGFDTKTASHAYRLAAEAVELAEEGRLTVPMRAPDREQAMAVKTGQVPLGDVLAVTAALRTRAVSVIDNGRTPLPASSDTARVRGRWTRTSGTRRACRRCGPDRISVGLHRERTISSVQPLPVRRPRILRIGT